MKELLIAIAQGLVEDPTAVNVDVDDSAEDGSIVYHLHVAEADMGRVIGKQGIKGVLAPGADADLIVLDEGLDIVHVMAKGRHAVHKGEALIKGKFEK